MTLSRRTLTFSLAGLLLTSAAGLASPRHCKTPREDRHQHG